MKRTPLTLEPELLRIGIQDSSGYHRIIDSTREQVNFHPDTTFRFFINNNSESFDMHWHPATEVIMPLENNYQVITGQIHYDLEPGDILMIPSGGLHQLIAPPTGLRLIYIFDSDLFSGIRGYSYLAAFLSQTILITPDNCPAIYDQEADLILKLCREHFTGGHMRELYCYSNLLQFLANYGEYRMEQDDTSHSPESRTERQTHLHEKLNTVFEYMDQNYMDNITLEMAADVAGFSKYHFSRLFKQCSGYNFYEYLCILRIKAAENLLLSPDLSITEVALQSGFSSLSTFNRTFKKKKGCTPSEYRALCSRKI